MKISFKPRARYITIHHLHIYIPDNASFRLHPRATHVFVRAELSGVNEQHSYRLIEVLEKADPARRLGVQISAFSSDGQTITLWGTKGGNQAALYANSLVDWLDQIPLKKIAKRTRRYIHLKSQRFLLKAEEKHKAKLGATPREERGVYKGMISQELRGHLPITNEAGEELIEEGTNVTFGLVTALRIEVEGITKGGDIIRRLSEAEFETVQETA
jgi:hypothetical protein